MIEVKITQCTKNFVSYTWCLGFCSTVKSFGINNVFHNRKHKKLSFVKSGFLGGNFTINL